MSKFFQAIEKAEHERALQKQQRAPEQRLPLREPPSSYVQYPRSVPDVEYEYSIENKEPGLRDYWKILLKHRRLAIGGFLFVFVLGACWTLSKTPLYTATATLKIEPRTTVIVQTEDRFTQTTEETGPYDYYKTQFALLESRSLAARVIADQNLIENAAFSEDDEPGLFNQWVSSLFESLESFVSYLVDFLKPPAPPAPSSLKEYTFGIHPSFIFRYLGLLEVEPVSGTRLVEIGFTTVDPQLSQQLANAHAAAFIQTALETRFELTKEAREFLEKKLAELRTKVERAEEALNGFRQTRGVVSLEGSENIVVDRMVAVNRRLTEATAKRIELESLYLMTEKKDIQSLSQIIENSLTQQMKASLATQEAEYARLASTYTSAHPRLVELQMQINQMRRRLDHEIAGVVRKIKSDYTNAQTQEATLQDEAQRQQQAALKFKEIGAEYTFLKEEADSNRALYERVLKRLHETSVANEGAVSNIEISEPADMPIVPSSPKTGRDLLLLAIGGLFVGAGLAWFRDYADSTVGTPEDVWRVASSPTLGVIPAQGSFQQWPYLSQQLSKFSSLRRLTQVGVATGGASSQELITAHSPLSVLAESYRNICARLLFAYEEQSPQVILLTSAQSGDGKTVTTLNLAITLAQSGRTVVVVDADVRKGRCHKLLHRGNRYGLTTVLAGEVSLDEAIQDTAVAGLSFLSRGASAPASRFSLGSPKMKEVVEILRERFEFVLIDSPPAITVSDATLLARLCDGVLLVFHGQRTTEESARRVVNELVAVHAFILGVVLNCVDLDSPDYADYRRYIDAVDAAVSTEET